MKSLLARQLICAASLLLLLAGCASNDVEENAPAELLDFKAERQLDKVWSSSVGDGQGEADYLRLTPVISGERIFAASTNGTVEAFNKTDGDSLWDYDIDEDTTIIGGVGVSGDLVLVNTTNGKLLALDAATGTLRWSATLPSEALGAPAGDGSVVAVHVNNGDIVGFAQADGKKLWTYSNTVPALTLRGDSSPLIYKDSIMCTFANGKIAVLETSTGSMRWEARVGVPDGTTELERLVDVDANPLVHNDVLYAVGYQGRLVAVSPENGALSWFKTASSHVNMAASAENIYVAGAKGTVTAFSINGDGVRWEQTAMSNRDLSGVAAVDSYVAVGDFEGYLHIMSQQDGHLMARYQVDSDGIRVAPIVDGNVMYVYTNSGDLIAYRVTELGSDPLNSLKNLF
jgi:outer membrane protein assembly factor BamB